MAEPPTTAPASAIAPERDALLATKLHVPRPRAGFLARPRLLERLTQGATLELSLVCAPAGFGKTSMLGEWARRGRKPVAWVSLDKGDSDPARFWRYLAAALDRPRPGIGQQVAALLRGPQQPPLEAVVTVVVNELAGVAEEVVLVLDDYHLIEAPPVHDSLAMLLERLPPGLRLVVASRADPPLPLARLRAGGQLAELRERDLRFTAEEAAALLREATGSELPADAVAALAARTEGWVAGLQLAALSLQGHADPAGFVHTFTGSHRYVLDYLTVEVLARQPKELVRFLLATSVLERLSGPLCDAVTGRSSSQALLEQIERANLFLVPLDEVRGWWRYHQLFADLLRARLQQHHPDRVPELHRAAATWSEQHGLVDDAIGHALAADDPQWAARLIEEHFDALLQRAEGATVDRWVQALPTELVRSRPRLLLAQAVWALLVGRIHEAEHLLGHAEAALAAAGDEPYEPSVGRAASLVANLPAAIAIARADLARRRGDADRVDAFVQQALPQLTEKDRALRWAVDRYLAVAAWQRGELAEAERLLVNLVGERWAPGEGFLAVRPRYDLGQVQRAQGRLGAALGTYRQVLAAAGGVGRPLPAAGMAHVGMAEVLYERGQLDGALEHASQGVGLCRQLAYTQPLLAGLATLAWIRHARGDRAGAWEAIAEAEQAQPSPAAGVVDLLNPVPALRAKLAIANGQVADAARWVQARGLDMEDPPSYPREREYLLLARLLVAEGDPERALELLERLRAEAAAQGRTGSVIEVRTLQALALDASGNRAGALDALAEALALGAPEGYVRVFLDEGAPMATLFGRLATTPARVQAIDGVPRAHLGRLLEAFEQNGLAVLPRPRPGGAVAAGLVAPLSPRELEVLQLLAAGKPNQVIAEELVITLYTVKRHVSHVLDKLGATNRTQAVSRARELGLLR
jgi:LuxR family transcriptional regulator, maltose regulon positive regulatory protein